MHTSDIMPFSGYPSPSFSCLCCTTGLSVSKVGSCPAASSCREWDCCSCPQACAAFARYLEIPQFAGGAALQGAWAGSCTSDSRINELWFLALASIACIDQNWSLFLLTILRHLCCLPWQKARALLYPGTAFKLPCVVLSRSAFWLFLKALFFICLFTIFHGPQNNEDRPL